MNIPKTILMRCDTGWTMTQKCGLTALLMAYWLSPIDIIPDFLLGPGQLDDLFFTYCLYRVWRSPTLSGTAAATSR